MERSKGMAGAKILLLCHFYPGAAGAIIDHIQAFRKFSKNEYFVLSNLGDLPPWLDLSCFDALVFHYSLIACYDNYISPTARKQIREFGGFKAAFVQDDYRWINDTVDALAFMRIHALFPLAGPEIIDAVYSPQKLPGVRKETVLAGYVPEHLVGLAVKPLRERPMDVAYRARKLPAWMGSHTLQKWQIAERFLADAQRIGLTVDISCREEDRIYGEPWTEFVSGCKATLGTESGASICDFTGDIQRKVEAHVKDNPDADFETLKRLYFEKEDGRIMMNVISPRCFEAAALRTLMILYEGHYSGVLIPWRHFVPLKSDHSNMREVVEILRSPEQAQEIVDRAYREVALDERYSYAAMVRLVDRVMDEEYSPTMARGSGGYRPDEFDWLMQGGGAGGANALQPPREMIVIAGATAAMDGLGATTRTEIALRRPMTIEAVAIRWDVDAAPMPRTLEIQCLRGTRVVDRQNAVDPQAAFQVCRLRDGVRRISSVRVLAHGMPPLGARGPLRIAVVGFETGLGRPLFNRTKSSMLQLLMAGWRATPEGVRRVLRPIARAVKAALQ